MGKTRRALSIVLALLMTMQIPVMAGGSVLEEDTLLADAEYAQEDTAFATEAVPEDTADLFLEEEIPEENFAEEEAFDSGLLEDTADDSFFAEELLEETPDDPIEAIPGEISDEQAGDHTFEYNSSLTEVDPVGAGAVQNDGTSYWGEEDYIDRVHFDDVTDPSQFFYEPVYWAVEKGITKGYDDNTFRPYNNCNRAAVVTFLWRLAKKPEPHTQATFSDMTGNAEFDKAISWAVEKGITTGWTEDNTFRPWATCNRAAIVTFLWRYAGRTEPTAMAAFRDMTGNEDFDKAISWAAENGIVTGWAEDNTFRPWNQCTRLAVVSFLYRFQHL